MDHVGPLLPARDLLLQSETDFVSISLTVKKHPWAFLPTSRVGEYYLYQKLPYKGALL